MSLTALAFLGIYGLGIILAFVWHPRFGLFSYLWDFYLYPPDAWWSSQVPAWRWSLIAGIVTLISLLWWNPTTAKASSNTNWPGLLLIAFTSWMWLQTLWAANTTLHIEGAILLTKYLLLFYLLYRIVSDEKSLEFFSWAHVLGCFILGWIAYRDPVAGRLETIGGPGVGDANSLGAHLITGIAFAGFMFLGIPGKRRWLALAAIPFMLNTIILTSSRGAGLGVLAAGLAAWYLVPRSQRHLLYMVAPLAVVLFLMLAHSMFWERMGTIPVQSEDEIEMSALTRVELLGANWKMFKDNPWGAGHRGNEVISPQYLPKEFLSETGFRSAHNTFMAVLVDQGLPGAIAFTTLMLWAACSILRLKALDMVGLPTTLAMYRAAIGTALVGLFVSGQFINLFKAEVQIWLLALLVALKTMCRNSLFDSRQRNGS